MILHWLKEFCADWKNLTLNENSLKISLKLAFTVLWHLCRFAVFEIIFLTQEFCPESEKINDSKKILLVNSQNLIPEKYNFFANEATR